MLFHYIKIAFRNLARQKVLAGINIAGLTIGIACFTLFLLYAVNELSYDRFHAHSSQIYRVYDWWDFKGEKPRAGKEPSSNLPLAPAMKQDFPDVLNYVRIQPGGSQLMHTGLAADLQRVDISYADREFFSLFTFPLLYGNARTALDGPSKIVLTREKALQLFGEPNPIGRDLHVKKDSTYVTYTVSAIAKDIPVNSSIHFDVLGSMDNVLATEMGKKAMNNWHMTIGTSVYIQLREGSNLANDQARLNGFYAKYHDDDKESLVKEGLWDGQSVMPTGYGLQPLADLHFNAVIDESSTAMKNIWILVGIAGAILIIACINFMTLAIGRSAGRAKEIGVRKVMGGQMRQLIRQFLAESFILSLLSAVLGLLLAFLLLPFFNELSGKELQFNLSLFPEMIPLLIGLVLVVGLLAGSYPAWILSRFRPIEVLKNKVRLAGSNLFTRSLVTFQFVLSIGLIIATAIILQQLSFMRSRDLGFAKENIVMVNADGINVKKTYPIFQQMLAKDPVIVGVTASFGLGAGEGQMGRGYKYKDKKTGVIEYPVDADYLPVMGMRLIAGRNFDPAIASDTINTIIVNEALVKHFFDGNAKEAIGQQISAGKGNAVPSTIIGVTRDFNFEDLTKKVRPQVFKQMPDQKLSRFFVRIGKGDPGKALASIGAAWKSISPELPLRYSFVDEKFNRFYDAEMKWSAIVGWAGGISIFLACLGLFGLAALAAVNRTKEIGIRKVMGATVTSIVGLMAKDFVKLVIIALVIAVPVAWYFMNGWLQDYAYRINISAWVFVITGIVAVGIAVFTVGLQAIKTALINPVKSLRNE
jgi:putative ABC transport system permease protein